MLKKIIITRKEEVKRGKDKNNQDWTLWNVWDSENNKYSTFQDLQIDEEQELECTEETFQKRDGSTGKSFKLSRPKRSGGVNPQVIQVIREEITDINRRLDSIEVKMNTLRQDMIAKDKAAKDPHPT